MAQHNAYGQWGEIAARHYLQAQGYIVKELNWRWKHKEIDIICMHKNELVFVEVKSRSVEREGMINDMITQQKQSFLIDAAHQYIQQKNIDLNARFDVVLIVGCTEKYIVRHFTGAFGP